jgi:hypothetical protein
LREGLTTSYTPSSTFTARPIRVCQTPLRRQIRHHTRLLLHGNADAPLRILKLWGHFGVSHEGGSCLLISRAGHCWWDSTRRCAPCSPMSIPNSPPYSTPDMSDGAKAEPFVSTSYRRPGAYHVLLLTTGSVASIKIPLIVQALLDDPNGRFEVQVAATNTSLTFFDPKSVEQVSKGKSRVWSDEQEWGVSRITCECDFHAQVSWLYSTGKIKEIQYYISK